jgi:hypothetical protein
VPEQEREQIEDLRLDGQKLCSAPQLAAIRVKRAVSEQIKHLSLPRDHESRPGLYVGCAVAVVTGVTGLRVAIVCDWRPQTFRLASEWGARRWRNEEVLL